MLINLPSSIKTQLAVQMYTVREYTQSAMSLAETLAKIREIGYAAVQMSAVGAMDGDEPEVTAQDVRSMLDDSGLRCVATHRGWDSLVQNTEYEIDLHQILGCDFTAIGSIPGIYRTEGLDGFLRWTDEANRLTERLNEAGIRFGYHNHDFEFEYDRTRNQSFYGAIVERGLSNIFLELDIYWAQHAGVDPLQLIEKLHGRLPVVHVKDKEIYNGQPVMAPVGEGNLNWNTIIPALQAAGTEWFAVEQDVCLRDPFDCLRSSYRYLTGA